MSLLLLRILLAFSLLLISEASEVDSEHYDDGSGNEQDAGEFFPKESQYSDEEDYNYTYEYDEDYGEYGEEEDVGSGNEDGGGGEHGTVVESELHYVPEMLSKPLVIREDMTLWTCTLVNIGQTVKLPCSAKDSTEFVRMWKHGERLLFTDRLSVSSDPRFSLDEGDAVSLLVRDVVPEDAGKYTCSIMVRSGEALEITHEVEVLDAVFSVRPVPSSGLVTVNEGDSAALECRVFGIPANSSDADGPRFSWRREGLPFTSNGQHSFEGDRYDIPNATRDDAGHYFCTAEANVGETRTASLQLVVMYRPRIATIEMATIRSGTGLNMEISCVIHGHPEPKVTWYKDEEVLFPDERVSVSAGGTRHQVTVVRVRPSVDAGTYMCYSTNELGAAQDRIIVSEKDISDSSHDVEKIRGAEGRDDEEELLLDVEKRLEQYGEDIEKLRADVDTVRNETRLSSSDSASTLAVGMDEDISLSLFADLERVQMQVARLGKTQEKESRDIFEFRRAAEDDLARMWDDVHELQEFANASARQLEDIYDKDVVALQDFRTSAEQEVKRLRDQLEAMMLMQESAASADEGGGSNVVARDIIARLSSLESLALQLDPTSLDRSKVFGEELQRVFQDIDNLKKSLRESDQSMQMQSRELRALKEGEVADVAASLAYQEGRIAELEHFRSEAGERILSVIADYDAEKIALVIGEMQKIKSQIYYLQQSVLQMKTLEIAKAGSPSENGTLDAASSRGSEHSANAASAAAIELLKRNIAEVRESCLEKSEFEDFKGGIRRWREREGERGGESSREGDEEEEGPPKLLEELTESRAMLTAANVKIAELSKRVDRMEEEGKKYNVIIRGLRQQQKLERPLQLDALVLDFLTQQLGLEDAHFDEARRVQHDNADAKSIVVRFPSVREKTRVLSAGRSLPRGGPVSVSEDFTDRVKLHRKRLAAFARRRARASKRKWALKYDRLYFSGRVFVFDEERNRVLPTRKL